MQAQYPFNHHQQICNKYKVGIFYLNNIERECLELAYQFLETQCKNKTTHLFYKRLTYKELQLIRNWLDNLATRVNVTPVYEETSAVGKNIIEYLILGLVDGVTKGILHRVADGYAKEEYNMAAYYAKSVTDITFAKIGYQTSLRSIYQSYILNKCHLLNKLRAILNAVC